eukprot:gene10258-21403_t
MRMRQQVVRSFSVKVDSFLSGSSSLYVEQMYDAWRKDPQSVHVSWSSYFANLESGIEPQMAFASPSSTENIAAISSSRQELGATVSPKQMSDSLGLSHLIRAYQVRGHEIAKLNPLGFPATREQSDRPPELDYRFHGFKDSDLDRQLNLLGTSTGGNTGFLEALATSRPNITLRQIIANLEKTYCSTLGVEYMHIASREKCNWIRNQVETPKWMKFAKEKKLHILERLCFADHFEKYLANKYNTSKRFGLEGGESCIPGLKCMIDRGSELGVESFVFGMPHRGRLNVLANVMRKPMPQIFREFEGTHYEMDEHMNNDWSSSGDVKYHLGTSMDRSYPDGRRVHLGLVANPSHLEAVNPVVIGKVRAKQFLSGNREEDKLKHMAVLLHGDAAFAGQGIVYETLQMARVADFAVGGTIHVIVNNQVGFTTDPINSRSTMYASDIGKAFSIPIFHCNGDDPMAVVTAFEMAVEWRQQYGDDCIIDMICYRRYGHNELDQPMYTQPQLYDKINKHPDTLAVYEKSLVAEGTCTEGEIKEIRSMVTKTLEKEFEASKTWVTQPSDWLSSKWKGFLSPKNLSRIRETGVNVDRLKEIGLKSTEIPASVNVHRQLRKIIEARRVTVETGEGIDWATAEALAFGTLLLEGNHVRLTGQDVQRGTFSHRHAVLTDQLTGESYVPLNHLAKHLSATVASNKSNIAPDMQAELTVRNSILSEFGVLGFEMGYSLENPNMLVLWEAQFGDFVNGAQIMIDQFISAGEDKWLRMSGLTMLLPHGYMGQGAEHSSCRMERFLQQVDEDPDFVPAMGENERKQIQMTNWQVVNCSTPANYYHVLRRQVHRDFRKPLVIVTPKNLLREKRATSRIEEMGEGERFKRIYPEMDADIVGNASKVRKLIYCTGKFYYELLEAREKLGLKDIAIVRIEQLAPFPWDKVAREAALYVNAEVVWCQEEPKNMGAWSFVQPRIATATRSINQKEMRPLYFGRRPAAATATGLGVKLHMAEQSAIIAAAFS